MKLWRKQWLYAAVSVLALLLVSAFVWSHNHPSLNASNLLNPKDPYLNGAPLVQRDGGTVTVSSTFLTPQVSKRLLELLSEPGVTELRLGYMPGGHVTADFFRHLDLRRVGVVITGPCASACAMIAATGRSIRFERGQVNTMPPFLLFHGVRRVGREQPGQVEHLTEASLKLAQLIRRRFPVLRQADVDEAMRRPSSDASGLVVTHEEPDQYVFSACTPWPDKCRELSRVQAESL